MKCLQLQLLQYSTVVIFRIYCVLYETIFSKKFWEYTVKKLVLRLHQVPVFHKTGTSSLHMSSWLALPQVGDRRAMGTNHKVRKAENRSWAH